MANESSTGQTAQARQMEEAAKRADWMQVVLNQGPPCFALNVDGDGKFCLRAERWAGHGPGEWPMHEFVSLADLIAALTSASAAKDEMGEDTNMADWRPINTAPRDSRHILIYVPAKDPPRQEVMQAWWAIPYESAPPERGWWQTMGGVCLSADLHAGLGATHWMPLPDPPSESR